MKGEWQLSNGEREKYTPYIRDCIERLNNGVEYISLNDTTLNPENAKDILNELGYSQCDFNSNGWEFDFEYTFIKEEEKAIVLSGTGVTFALGISLNDE